MNFFQFFSSILVIVLCSSCVTSRTLKDEKLMEQWLEQATLPVMVQIQSNEFRCRPSLNCYTLIDAKGKVHYARNVRHQLPRMIPEDSTMIRPRFMELLFGR